MLFISKCVSVNWDHSCHEKTLALPLVWVVFSLQGALKGKDFFKLYHSHYAADFFCCLRMHSQLSGILQNEWKYRVHASLYGFSLRQMWLEYITEVWRNFILHVCYWLSCSSPALHSCTLKSWFLKEKLSVCTNLTPFCRMFFQDVCSSCVWEYSTCSGQTCPL